VDAIRLDSRRKGKLLALEVGARITSADQKCFEIPATEDEGIDMELEFTDDEGKGTGKRLYLQLKSGNSHLERRKNGEEVFTIREQRWVDYWLKQPNPLMLVIGTFAEDDERSVGREKLEFAEVRWMEISTYLKRESQNGSRPVKQIVFKGERMDMTSIRRWRDKMLDKACRRGQADLEVVQIRFERSPQCRGYAGLKGRCFASLSMTPWSLFAGVNPHNQQPTTINQQPVSPPTARPRRPSPVGRSVGHRAGRAGGRGSAQAVSGP